MGNHGLSNRRWRLFSVVAVIGAAVAGAGGGTFGASNPPAVVKSYAGCLSNGGVAQLNEGDFPERPCPPGKTEIHLGGGDITSVSVGPGLTGGGTNGALTIALDPRIGLPQTCSNGNVVKWNATAAAWQCATDSDLDTTYTAGVGLALLETSEPFEVHQFRIETGYRLPQGCASGEVPQKAGSGWVCAAGPGAGSAVGRAYVARSVSVHFTGPDAEVASLTLPAGSYVINGLGHITNGDADTQPANCKLSTGEESDAWLAPGGEPVSEVIPVQDAATFADETVLTMTCSTFKGAGYGVLTATAVAAIN